MSLAALDAPLLAGRVAMLTGAAGGIGGATAEVLARSGADLVLTDLHAEALEAVSEKVDALGVRVLARSMDVTDLGSVQAVIDEACALLGGLDIAVNLAGGPAGADSAQPIEQLSADAWARSITLNLTGAFNVVKAAQPAMRARGGGAIVAVGSLASIRMSTHAGVGYTAAKSGVLGLVRHAAFEFARDGIRVNAVLPGMVDGPLMRSADPSATREAEGRIPLGRMTTGEQIAKTVLYLSSSLSDGVTGEYVVVDGGMQIGSPTSSRVYFEARASAPATNGV